MVILSFQYDCPFLAWFYNVFCSLSSIKGESNNIDYSDTKLVKSELGTERIIRVGLDSLI